MLLLSLLWLSVSDDTFPTPGIISQTDPSHRIIVAVRRRHREVRRIESL